MLTIHFKQAGVAEQRMYMSCSFRQFPAHNFRKETSMEENYSIEGNELHVVRNHKDTVFRMLYNDKEKLLELYNGMLCFHGTLRSHAH